MNNGIAVIEKASESLIHRLREHDLLKRCREGKASLNELKTLLVQQGFYSQHFVRYVCALMANLHSNNDIKVLAENLFEELGFLEESRKTHSTIYREMLEHFSLSLDTSNPNLETQSLIDCMFNHCRNSNSAEGLGALCLGAEALVSTFYTDIISGFNHLGVKDEHLEFFHLHVECDDGHTETLLEIMGNVAKEGEHQTENMIMAGRALVDARLNFLTGVVNGVDQSLGQQASNQTLLNEKVPSY